VHNKFVATIKETVRKCRSVPTDVECLQVVGMGQIVEWDEEILRQSMRHNGQGVGVQVDEGGKVCKHCWRVWPWRR
jgi:hypothetical protein